MENAKKVGFWIFIGLMSLVLMGCRGSAVDTMPVKITSTLDKYALYMSSTIGLPLTAEFEGKKNESYTLKWTGETGTFEVQDKVADQFIRKEKSIEVKINPNGSTVYWTPLAESLVKNREVEIQVQVVDAQGTVVGTGKTVLMVDEQSVVTFKKMN